MNIELKEGGVYIEKNKVSWTCVRKIRVLEVTETTFFLENMDIFNTFRVNKVSYLNDYEIIETVVEPQPLTVKHLKDIMDKSILRPKNIYDAPPLPVMPIDWYPSMYAPRLDPSWSIFCSETHKMD